MKVDEFPDDHHPNNHDRDLLGGPPDNFDYNNNNNNNVPNPLGADHKIDPDPPKRDGGSVKVDPPDDAADPNNEHKLDKLPQEDNQVKTGSEMHIRFHGEDKNQGNRGVENDGTNPSDFINQLSEAGVRMSNSNSRGGGMRKNWEVGRRERERERERLID